MAETPEQKAESLNQQWEDSKARAESRPLGQPAQLPVNPATGSDDASDGENNTAS